MASRESLAPLVERGPQVEMLRQAWRRARAGHGSLWLLCAEAGGGKTRLADECVRSTGAAYVWGAAEPVAPPDPYLAVVRALPGFRPASTRAASVEAAIAALEQTGARPLVVVFDDLHFADEGTVAVVARLGIVCATRPWLVIATCRPGEGPSGLLSPLVELTAQNLIRRLDLPPLSRAAVATLVEGVRGRPADGREADAIFRDSGGNPWFAEMLARGSAATPLVRDRISLRLDRIEAAHPGAAGLLTLLAAATGPLPHDVVARLAGGDHPELRRALGGLRDAGVLSEEDGGWRFRHELLRRSLYEALIAADRRDAHRALAEAMEFPVPGSTFHGASAQPSSPSSTVERGTWNLEPERRVSAATIAMQYAAAGDDRAVAWALRAAEEARAVDAHREAMAQLERALSFALAPATRRGTLAAAAAEAYTLGRFEDNRRLAEEALAIPGGTAEERAHLHQHAARAALQLGDLAGDDAHLAAAEELLAQRPVTAQTANIAVARAARVALAIEPDRLASRVRRALDLADLLDNADRASWVRVSARRFLAVSRIECGDPAGFAMLEDALAEASTRRLAPGTAVSALGSAYEAAVIALFHREAAALRERLHEAIGRHEMGFAALVEPHHALELVQTAQYDEAGALGASVAMPRPATREHASLIGATALREMRTGSAGRARAVLESAQPGPEFFPRAVIELAWLEMVELEGAPGRAERARALYDEADRRQYARVAGTAAVALARAGYPAPVVPAWLVEASPLHALWDWAGAIERRDTGALRGVADRLAEMSCPYEAALALRDAGALGEAYRALRALGAGAVRTQVAEQLRLTNQRIPRRTRSADAAGGLTETERQVCRLVVTGAANKAIAAALTVSERTVETHLTHIYEKTGCRGRAALIAWWSRQAEGSSATS
jgi:DNA-binding CsgD family transcriptional regulator